MPKVKTNKSAVKRVARVSGTGKVVMRKMSVAHRARFKSKRAKQLSTQKQVIGGGMAKKMKELI